MAIPSPIVMTKDGTIVGVQRCLLFYLLVVADIRSMTKIGAGLLLYMVTNIARYFLLSRLGKFLVITQDEIEKIKAYISHNWKNDVILVLLCSISVMPNSPIPNN